MNYQLLINLTDHHENKSYDELNLIVNKRITHQPMTKEEIKVLRRIRCYTLLIISVEQIKFRFIGKNMIVENKDDIKEVSKMIDPVSLKQVYSNDDYVTVKLKEGLGNNLFQLFAMYCFANQNNKKFRISKYVGCHSGIDYEQNLFKNFVSTEWDKKKYHHNYFQPAVKNTIFIDLPVYDKSAGYEGFFQNEKFFKYIKHELPKMLNFNGYDDVSEYPNLGNSIFIHVRLGDYVNNPRFDVGLDKDNYYDKAFKVINQRIKKSYFIYIFSDDVKKCKMIPFINSIDKHKRKFVEENEIKSLYIMSQCHLGGICPNSTFSWWGSYLNQNPDKVVVFPKKWNTVGIKIDIQYKGLILI